MSAVRHGPQGQASLSHASERDAMGRDSFLSPVACPATSGHWSGPLGGVTAEGQQVRPRHRPGSARR